MIKSVEINTLKDTVFELLNELENLSREEKNEYNKGSMMAYANILGIIKSYTDEEEWERLRLNFDIDKKYL